jgi:hypothetical protein
MDSQLKLLILPALLMLANGAYAQSEDAANQGLVIVRPSGGLMPNSALKSTMDKVFGAGAWRETGGYRSEAREDELRREGAGTVPAGQISHHSMGTPDAPGAYDIVVAGMSTESAAEKLKNSSDDFSRVFAEGAHGGQGSHLHVEPKAGHLARGGDPQAPDDSNIYLRVSGGRRNPALDQR